MGYSKHEMTGHGFRSTAATLLHELGYMHAVIERQLAHGERNKVSASYNFAEYLPAKGDDAGMGKLPRRAKITEGAHAVDAD